MPPFLQNALKLSFILKNELIPTFGVMGMQFLHPSEAELCAVLRLLPSQYLACKDAMQREYKKQQQDLSKDEIKAMSHMDPHKAVRVYEYLKSCGVFS